MINLFKKKNSNFKKGFTLVETLIAISIFTLSITAMMSVLSSGISNTNIAKKKIIATYLAQEGIEYVRNMRDSAVIANPLLGWTDDFIRTLSESCGASCDITVLNLQSGISSNPGFLGTIYVHEINSDELKIYSKVTWTQPSGDQSVEFSEHLFNWVE